MTSLTSFHDEMDGLVRLPRQYLSREQFYAADPRRLNNPERQYGDWRMTGYSLRWQVGYLANTGELYATQQWSGPYVPTVILGVVAPDQPPLQYHETLDGILEGWADECAAGNTLAWVFERLEAAGALDVDGSA